MKNTGKILMVMIGVAVLAMAIEPNISYGQERPRASEAETMVRECYGMLFLRPNSLSTKQQRETTNNLREWIPKYRVELEKKKKKALKENDESMMAYCNDELSWLDKIEDELYGIDEKALFPIEENGKYGYIDKKGKVVIEPRFSDAGFFSEGLADVYVEDEVEDEYGFLGGYWGYIDRTGNIVIEPQFDHAHGFHEGLACVSDYFKWGYIDKTGNVVIELQFYHAHDFHEGLASVARVGDGKWGYIDKTGNIVIEPQFDHADDFHEGLACVIRIEDGKWKYGYIDKTGNIVIEPQFDHADDFHEGLAYVYNGKKRFFINKKGDVVLGLFDEGTSFSEGLASVKLGGKSYYIDRTGKIVMELQSQNYDYRSFKEGLALIRDRAKGIGFIDRSGRIAIELQFDDILRRGFIDGLAWVKKDGKWGYIDKTGKFVWRQK